MKCPKCGAGVSQAGSLCPACQRQRPIPGTATLTPVPGSDSETVYVAPEQETVLFDGIRPPDVRFGGDDSATVYRPASDSTGLPPGAVRNGHGAASPASSDSTTIGGDSTRLTVTPGGVRDTPSLKSATGPLHIGQQFGPRYIIVKLLGIGGMGAVYQAWDAEL